MPEAVSFRKLGNTAAPWPDGPSGMAELIRSKDWSTSLIGVHETWNATLRTTVDMLVACQFPMVLLWGKELVQIYNDGYRAVMGVKHPQGMGQATQECWPEVWEFNRPVYERVWQGESLTFEDQLFSITRHGFLEDAYFTLCYSPVRDETNSIVGILVTVFETTALIEATRKREASEAALYDSEERLRLALSAANGVGIWDWDVVADRFYADRKFALLYGVNPDLAAQGTPLSAFIHNIHSEDLDRVQHAIQNTLDRRLPYSEEYRLIQEDGSIRWVSAQGYALLSSEGKALRFPGVTTDITDRKKAEEALRQSEKLAAVGRLASSMAHEINNPLESVTNLLYLARNGKDELPPDIADYLEAAERELRRVSLITNQALRFHKQTTQPQCVSCLDLIGGALLVYQGRFVNSGIEVEKRKRATTAVRCFEGEIRQVLANLIGNAIDAMHPTGGRLLLRSRDATNWKTGKKGLVITIADSGLGMSAAVLKRMFEAFFTTKGIGGTGLGLWLSREIVERHQGELHVRSSQREGRNGTVFALFLPYDAVSI